MGEITLKDPFGRAIAETVERYNFRVNLEIGAWDGSGSTQCFIEGMIRLKDPRVLYCLETNDDRLKALCERVKEHDFAVPVGMSSISNAQWLVKDFDADVWESPYNKIDKQCFPRELVYEWYQSDQKSIGRFKQGFLEVYRGRFDSVLIDGSSFTGYSEFNLLEPRVKCFFLDDYHKDFKTNQVFHELVKDPNWELLHDFPDLRNGACIFIRRMIRWEYGYSQAGTARDLT